MNRTVRFLLLLILIPLMIAAFYLDARLQLSTVGHKVVQIVIVAVTYWLSWRWVVYDETRQRRKARRSEPLRYSYRIVSPQPEMEAYRNEAAPLWLAGTADAAGSRMVPWQITLQKMADVRGLPAHAIHALLSMGVVFALTVVMLLIGSKTLGEGVIAILYLLPIGWCTTRWGKLAGVSSALTAALSFDFLFIPPYGTFTIGRLEGWLLLFLFIVTAILVVGRIQSILREEQEREQKATFLYEVVAAIANQTTREGIARAMADQVQQKFLAEGVRVHLTGGWGYQPFTVHAGNRRVCMTIANPDRALAIVSGSAHLGEIDIWQGQISLPSEADLMLQTMLGQVAAALDRARVAEGNPPYPGRKPSYHEGNPLQASQS